MLNRLLCFRTFPCFFASAIKGLIVRNNREPPLEIIVFVIEMELLKNTNKDFDRNIVGIGLVAYYRQTAAIDKCPMPGTDLLKSVGTAFTCHSNKVYIR